MSEDLLTDEKSKADAEQGRRYAHVVYLKHALNRMITDKEFKDIFE
jgi:hypothetical protein